MHFLTCSRHTYACFLCVGPQATESTFHTACIPYVVGLPVTAVFCSAVTAVVVCCARKGKEQKRYKQERKEPAQKEPVYDTPVCTTNNNAELVLKENVCYGNKQYI